MKNNYFIEFSSSLSKDEKNILVFLIKKYLKDRKLDFKIDSLDIPKLKNCKKLYLERFAKKGIFFIENDENKTYCNFINFISFKNEYVNIELNNYFLDYCINNEKKFNYSLKEVLYLKHNFSILFFYKIIKNNILANNLKIQIDKLKNILEVDTYERLYDFKRFILNPLIEDINKNTNFKMEYKIEKENNIYFVLFYIKNNKIEKIKNYSSMFIKLYKHHIKNKKRTEEILFKSINLNGYDYVKEKILFSIKNKYMYKLNFDDILEKVLNNEIGEFYIKLKAFEGYIENIDTLKKILFKELKLLDFPEISRLEYNTELTKLLFKIKNKEPLIINSENLKVELIFNNNGNSKIDIYKKYIKSI